MHTPGVGTHKFHTNAKTWTEARKICENEGNQLVVVNSRAEAQAIVKLFTTSGPHNGSIDKNQVHIGFSDVHQENQYITVDGTSLKEAGFEDWLSSNPSNRGGGYDQEDCGAMWRSGELNDVPCPYVLSFVCEVPILDQGTSVIMRIKNIPWILYRPEITEETLQTLWLAEVHFSKCGILER